MASADDVRREGIAIGEVLLGLALRKGGSRQSVVAAAAYMLRGALLELSPDEQVRWDAIAAEIVRDR
jgi:hypothetical protein